MGLSAQKLSIPIAVTAANTSLLRKGNWHIAKLRQSHTQQIKFILGQLICMSIGKGSNGNCHFIRGSKVRISFFCGSFLIKNKLQIPITNRQKNILRRVNITLLQLLIQPGQIQPHAFQIILQNAAVHD